MIDTGIGKQTVLEFASLTDRGLVRELNEDSAAVVVPRESHLVDKGAIMIVADGMGGHEAGEVASRMVTEELPILYYGNRFRNSVENLIQAVAEVNRRVYRASETMDGERGMGTTLVACVVTGKHLITVNVGDSRAYILRDGTLRRLSKDHTLHSDAFGGFDARSRESFSHVLTRAIGPEPEVSPHVTINHIHEGDILLLCSDGLTGVLDDDEIKDILASYPTGDAAQVLVEKSKEKGGDDNVTVIVSKILEVAPPRGPQIPMETL